MKKSKSLSLWLLLGVGFLDYLGIGLVFPLFSILLFDPTVLIVPPETSQIMRGTLLGLLIGVTPLVQFFASPALGMLSDQKGRKKVLIAGLAIGCMAYVIGVFGLIYEHLYILLLYRMLFGISAASAVVVSASIADLSMGNEKAKTKNFGLYGMALGLGFTFGPFLGGNLAKVYDNLPYSLPFIVAAGLTFINLVLILWKYRDTHVVPAYKKVSIFLGFIQIKQAMKITKLRVAFLTLFIFWFGWDFFIEFVPVFLINRFHFDAQSIGNFYGYMGLTYAVSSGYLIRFVSNRFHATTILQASLFLAGATIVGLVGFYSVLPLVFYVLLVNFSIALIIPNALTEISNTVSENMQGEIMGIYGSIQSLALMVSPIFSGFLVGWHYVFPAVVGGSIILAAAVVFLIGNYRRFAKL